ncbi:recombinase family protein [Kitasatospora sp. NPDC093550]|uniref:recombinase family protein n=1 Tax=Kitasatospora sp. NPDC093550 TaxID=3364089 RepID=UPI0038045119
MHTTGPAPCAVYLRCYPADHWTLDTQQRRLRAWALEDGLAEPAYFCDNGVPSRSAKPRLRDLLEAARLGWIRHVLVPGLFVFDLDDQRAATIAAALQEQGVLIHIWPGDGPSRTYTQARPPATARTAEPFLPVLAGTMAG